jgi:hypothetical protein
MWILEKYVFREHTEAIISIIIICVATIRKDEEKQLTVSCLWVFNVVVTSIVVVVIILILKITIIFIVVIVAFAVVVIIAFV